ncbi:fumarylacetoacetate hydrolase family protein [Bacillus sp. sid0103]|uniref:fumarylacetoacetate hydrolase family protein n=1 Tax=Bacillus sp. sid0103 TaxID=2856337 RepID=UPI001C4605FD|nr:fumarylacetoacetate hydrolase family protein [Bacillus sp. sid0103]MBV7504365.1 fumarylacetoacetate hydrolase family protein [Bacillus sp. sid0103]
MKLLTFYRENRLNVGIKLDAGILEIPQSFEEIVSGGQQVLEELSSVVNQVENGEIKRQLLNEEELQLGPCVPNPGKIICIGLNYRKHAEETNAPIPEYPIIFNKFNNTLTAHQAEIAIPNETNQLDYEAELVIVVGKKMKHVAREDAHKCVLGYCATNDLSARDLQFRTNQWLLGKTCDGFSPLGPYLVTSEEIENPNQLAIKSYVNGELRQRSNTSDMIFDCEYLLSYLSQYMTLSPGDIVLTGTPEGVVLGYPPEKQAYLKEGDRVDIEIEGLGVLTNTFVKRS